MSAKIRRKPKALMSKQEAEDSLRGTFEDLVIDGDLLSFTDHAGINIPHGVDPDHVWSIFRSHYAKGKAGVDIGKFAADFATWGPIAARVIEIKQERSALRD
ncbi:hypothetical protein [Bradyrhizobium sp.]|uniref:hypothetical protein n=1 Tax=Bradyrhizobium sp. TaxID=376 RepID=UPI003C2556D5